jgi:glycosyltransferase involved in cell wall biosynthesis
VSAGRIVVIGDPRSVFVQAPVRYWRRLGIDAVIVTARWTGGATVADGLPVVNAETIAPAAVGRVIGNLHPFLRQIDRLVEQQDSDRIRRALGTWGPTAQQPSLVPPLQDAAYIAAAVETLAPVCVLGQEAFAYGLATAWSPVPRKALVVWGADVLHYAETSNVAHGLVRQALNGVRYVVTNAAPMVAALRERFDVPLDRIAALAWGVDRRLFHPPSTGDQARIRTRHGIPTDAPVLMNLRRLLPHWNAATAWETIARVLDARPDVHAVLLDGSDDRLMVDRIERDAEARGLRGRLTVQAGTASLETVAELMSVADVSLSLVDSLEPLSWSVLQAAASGSALVIGDQPTYRDEAAKGLSATFVPPCDADRAARVALDLLADPAARGHARTANERYIALHHDHDRQMARLLRITAGAEMAAALMHPAA